jgi:adenosylmethionine-8-amino-7-oxononanoate aminotransferase
VSGAHDAVFTRDLHRHYPLIVRGEGVYLYDDAGRRYLDGCSGALVANLGMGVPQVADAIAAQARECAFAHMSVFLTEPAIRLAEQIASRAPAGLRHVYYATGGSEAVETALKLSRAYFMERDGATTPKSLVISRWHGWHGNTLGALSVSGHVPRRRPYGPMLPPAVHIEPCNAYRQPYGPDAADWDVRAAKSLEAAILCEGPERVAAFIAEPVVGAAAGAVAGTTRYFQTIREICDRHDVLFIADEVMAGFGRTGRYFSIEHFDTTPDMIVLGKGMAAGYAPLAGVLVHDRIYDLFAGKSGRFVHGHTYNGHAIACAAGAAVQDYMDEHRLVERAAAKGADLGRRLQALRRHEIVGDVRGLGMMWGIEFVVDRDAKTPPPRRLDVSGRVTAEAMKRGVMVYPGAGGVDGVSGDHILVGPPFVIRDAEIDELVGAVNEAIAAVASTVVAGKA